MTAAMLALFRREFLLGWRQNADLAITWLFFMLTCVLTPLSIGPDPFLLQQIAGGMIWIAATLATLLSMDRLFGEDYRSGELEQLLLTPIPLIMLVMIKAMCHWLTIGLPLILIAVPLALSLHLPPETLPVLIASLALGTPVLSIFGAMGSALLLGARRGNLLFAVLILPLYSPVVIFGAGAVDLASRGHAVHQPLMFLGGLLLISLAISPFAAATALRQALD